MLHIDGWTKLQEFSDILAWFYVLNDSIFIRSLLSLILVRAVSGASTNGGVGRRISHDFKNGGVATKGLH